MPKLADMLHDLKLILPDHKKISKKFHGLVIPSRIFMLSRMDNTKKFVVVMDWNRSLLSS